MQGLHKSKWTHEMHLEALEELKKDINAKAEKVMINRDKDAAKHARALDRLKKRLLNSSAYKYTLTHCINCGSNETSQLLRFFDSAKRMCRKCYSFKDSVNVSELCITELPEFDINSTIFIDSKHQTPSECVSQLVKEFNENPNIVTVYLMSNDGETSKNVLYDVLKAIRPILETDNIRVIVDAANQFWIGVLMDTYLQIVPVTALESGLLTFVTKAP